MRFMLLQHYAPVGSGAPPITEWKPEDVQAHIEFQVRLNQELTERGEFVDAQGLAGPDVATIVVSDGVNPPVITDGPFAEAKELLAGYRIVDVDSRERVLEIAAQSSAGPGPDGVPLQDRIEVREVMGAPSTDG